MADKMQRFTQRARRVLSLAQEEAERLHHPYIGTCFTKLPNEQRNFVRCYASGDPDNDMFILQHGSTERHPL